VADPVLFKNGYFAFTTATGSAVYVDVGACKSFELPLSKAELANSVMGDNGETFFPGLQSMPVTAVFRQDFGAAGIDVKMYNLWNNGAAIRIKARAVNAAVSTTNPSYIINRAYLFSITPISGAHGVLLENNVGIKPGSGYTLSRSTST
jgi:hypothetical protein